MTRAEKLNELAQCLQRIYKDEVEFLPHSVRYDAAEAAMDSVARWWFKVRTEALES